MLCIAFQGSAFQLLCYNSSGDSLASVIHSFVVTVQQSPLAVNDEIYCTLLNWRVISQHRGLSNFFLY